MPAPLPVDPDELNFRIASLLPSTLETVAMLVDTPDPDADLYHTLVGIANEAGYIGTLAAWRVAAGLAMVAGLNGDQVAALGETLGAHLPEAGT